jgi:hypothetical protein
MKSLNQHERLVSTVVSTRKSVRTLRGFLASTRAQDYTNIEAGLDGNYCYQGSLADSIIGPMTDGELRAQKGVGCQSSVLRNRDG